MHTALHTTFATTSSIPATSSSSATSSSWNRNPYVPSDFATSGSNRSTREHHGTWQLFQEKYSKGAEIYPVTNNNLSFSLSDSFPGGLVPDIVHGTFAESFHTIYGNEKRRDDSENRTQQKQPQFSSSMAKTTKTKGKSTVRPIGAPISVAICALITGHVPPSYLLLTIFLSGYLIVLGILASSSFSSVVGNQNVMDRRLLSWKERPVLPNLPPQGHVPFMVANPLGPLLSKSLFYQRWLLCGVVMGYILPILSVVVPLAKGCHLSSCDTFGFRHVVTSIFLLSVQMVTETVGKQLLLPLPLRIFIPLSYNSIRMVPLYQWIMAGWKGMVLWGKVLSLVNFFYWGANLFGFLIPVASLKYFKSHFLAVEAKEVVLRERHFD